MSDYLALAAEILTVIESIVSTLEGLNSQPARTTDAQAAVARDQLTSAKALHADMVGNVAATTK